MIGATLHERQLVEREAGRSSEAPAYERPRGERRGPMRPNRLTSKRQRLNGDVVAKAFAAADGVILAVAAAPTVLRASAAGSWISTGGTVTACVGYVLLCALLLSAFGAYGFRRRETLSQHLVRAAVAMTAAGLIVGAGLAIGRAAPSLVRLAVQQHSLSLPLVLLAHSLWLALLARWKRRGHLTQNVVVVGANENAARLIERAVASGEIAVLGVFDDRHERAPESIGGVPVLGSLDALLGHRIIPYVDRVVIAITGAAEARVRALVERLDALPNDIALLIDASTPGVAAEAVDRLLDLPLARLSGPHRRFRLVAAKRAQDLAFGAVALVVAAPLMAIIAVAVKLDSPGPVLFHQRRQGFNNEEFVVWKFRSMRHDRRDSRALCQVRYDDPRITRIGRLIRRTSLDELPQLFNVLRGEMSLVGPRPHAPDMKTGDVPSAQLVAHYAHRHRIKPGMTGWAAINGSRGPVDTPELVCRRVELDVAYIERQSFWFDLYIMLMTLPCLVGDRKVAR